MSKEKAVRTGLFIPVEISFFHDGRVNTLAKERGEDPMLTGARVQRTWVPCFERNTPTLSREEIQLAAELPLRDPWFADEMVAVRLAEKTEDGLYRLRGAADRLAAIQQNQENKSQQGRKAAMKRWHPTEKDAEPMPTHAEPMPSDAERCRAIQDEDEDEDKDKKERSDLSSFETTGSGVSEASGEVRPDLRELWNQNCGGMIRCKTVTPKRRQMWNARFRSNPNVEYWAEIIRTMARSKFCVGKNSTNWKADVDYFLRPGTPTRVEERTAPFQDVDCVEAASDAHLWGEGGP